MTCRLVYLYGVRGTGKTVFSQMLGPELVVGFVPIFSQQPPEAEGYPWLTCRAKPGDLVWPSVWNESGEPVATTPDAVEEYRRLAAIPLSAKVAQVHGAGFYAWAAGRVDQTAALREVQQRLLADVDVVVHDFPPLEPPRPDERVICLAASSCTLAARAENAKCWDSRSSFDEALFREYVRQIVAGRGRLWSTPHEALAYWWDGGHWARVEDVARDMIIRLGPWYQYHLLAGVETGSVHGLNGAKRWSLLRSHLPDNLRGVRVLDVGMNSGFNSLAAADAGAEVTAIECDERYLQQFAAVCEMGIYPASTSGRIVVIPRQAQTVPLADQRFDAAILSCVHYHINRSSAAPYRAPHGDYTSVSPLRAPLAVLLEDLAQSTERLILVTNLLHAQREERPYPEAHYDWVKVILEATGFREVRRHPGDDETRPILTAIGRGTKDSM